MNKKNVLVFLGSYRKNSNSTILGEEVVRGALDSDAGVETVRLSEVNINPCHGCDYCQAEDRPGCIQKDDMTPLYAKLLAADAIVLAGPVYWFSICAQIKLLIDRLYALGGNSGHQLAGKKIGIILTYADSDPFTSGAVNALRTFQDIFRYIGAEIAGMVYGSAWKPGGMKDNQILLEKAFELGKTLAINS